MRKTSQSRLAVGAGTLLVLGAAMTVTADDSMPEPLKTSFEVERQISQAAMDSQRRVDELDEETQEMLEEYMSVRQQTERLKVYNDQVERLIRSQEDEKASLREQIEDVEVVEREIVPLMIRMIENLERFVELDIPLEETEREERIAGLWDTMDRADVTVSEKFRQIMNAYQTEVEYGRTMAAYRDTLELNGQERDVDILQLGRVVLAYQTLDQRETGFWNPQANGGEGAWEQLPDRYRRPVQQGLRMARDEAADDILELPVMAPERVQ